MCVWVVVFLAEPLLDVQTTTDNKSVTISWRKDGTALLYYVMEWYSEGHMLDELRWIRVDRKETSIILTGKTLRGQKGKQLVTGLKVFIAINQVQA